MSAWVYVFPGKNDPEGTFVFAASKGNINAAWKGVNISGSQVPQGKWFKISGMFDLSDAKITDDYKLVFYFWNNSSTDILLDDFYVVFGGPKPRRGDSTLVDLTRGAPFVPKFNYPPYPFHLFGREETGNGNSSFLINKGKLKEGNISPFDRIIPGHFISDARGPEDLLVISKAGNVELYTFCRNDKEYRKIPAVIPAELKPFFQKSEIVSGCFSGGGTNQLLLSGPGGILIGEFEKTGKICSGDPGTSFKTLFKSTVNPFPAGGLPLVAADLEGKKVSEILATAADGSWKVYRFEKGKKDPLAVVASGNAGPVNPWDTRKNNVSITPGRFLQRYPQDLLLSVSGEKSKPGNSWAILRFDPVSRTFISCYSDKQKLLGKTIGRDSLKPSDVIITGIFDPSGKVKVFRYNRDWRYDLKEIRFNDSTFQVIANMDFTGYEKDYNPKYYELLRLVPLAVEPGISSLLVIGKNCKSKDTKDKECREFIDLPDLPGRTGIYSFQNTD